MVYINKCARHLAVVYRSRCSTLREKEVHSTIDTPSPGRNALLLSVGEEESQWDNEEVGADEEEELESDADKHKTALSPYKKKRSLSSAGEKLRLKRIKRRPFSSRLSSDEQTETGDDSDISSYTPFNLQRPNPLSYLSHSIDFDEHASDDSAMKCTDERRSRSRTAVIYEQRRWKGFIVDERDAKQRRGRPRKEYRVHWEDSRIDGARLTAPGLIQHWKEKKALKRRRRVRDVH